MATLLYAQWPASPGTGGSTGLVYFRFPLSKTFSANYADPAFKDGMAFCVYAVLTNSLGHEESHALGDIITRADCGSESGSNPQQHPDQVFFRRNQSKISNKMASIRTAIAKGEYQAIDRIEIHSSLVPCGQEHGCQKFLQNKLMGFLDPNNLGDINLRDIWVLTIRQEFQDFDTQLRAYAKLRGSKALTANARRLKNIGTPINSDPENGTIRCILAIEPGEQYPCKDSRSVLDSPENKEYNNLLQYQRQILQHRKCSETAPALPSLIQRWHDARLE